MGQPMPISEHDQAILDAFQEAANEDPDLSKYFEFHRTLYEALASAKAGISAS